MVVSWTQIWSRRKMESVVVNIDRHFGISSGYDSYALVKTFSSLPLVFTRDKIVDRNRRFRATSGPHFAGTREIRIS
jgi:hypothetical protein